MARLIDADALLDEFLKRYTGMEKDGNLVFAACEIKQDFADMISDFHTVDAVSVVRCKDCKYGYDDSCGICGDCCYYLDCVVQPEFYCAYGERKENGNG